MVHLTEIIHFISPFLQTGYATNGTFDRLFILFLSFSRLVVLQMVHLTEIIHFISPFLQTGYATNGTFDIDYSFYFSLFPDWLCYKWYQHRSCLVNLSQLYRDRKKCWTVSVSIYQQRSPV